MKLPGSLTRNSEILLKHVFIAPHLKLMTLPQKGAEAFLAEEGGAAKL